MSENDKFMDTACKYCIFSEKQGNLQTGCKYGNLEKFKNAGCEIIEAEDQDEQFFVIKNRLCMALRRSPWGESLSDEEKINKVRKDITTRITCILVVKETENNIENIVKTFKSAIAQKIKFQNIHFILEKKSSIKIGSLMNAIKPIECDIQWFVKQMVHDDFSFKDGIDEIVEKEKSVFSAIFFSGFSIPEDFVQSIDKSINDDLNRFIMLKPYKENGLVFQNKSFKIFGGNKDAINEELKVNFSSILEKVDFIAKDQNLTNLIGDIESICHSIKQV